MPRTTRRKPETRRRRIAPLGRRRIVVRNGLIAVVRDNSTKSLLANNEREQQADNCHGDHPAPRRHPEKPPCSLLAHCSLLERLVSGSLVPRPGMVPRPTVRANYGSPDAPDRPPNLMV